MNEFGAPPIAGASGFRDDGLGLWCDAGGAFLGGVALLAARRQADGSIRFSPRREDEIARLLRGAYGARFDGNTRMGGLRAVANGLNAGQECRAIIAALHMRLPSLTPLAKIMIERAERLIKAEWDESKHPRQPAGVPEGGQFAPAGGGAAAARPPTDREAAEFDMTEGGMAPPRALSAEERAAAERILRDLEAYAQTSAEALGRVPGDIARLIEQFKRDPIGTLRSLGPSLSGINVALTPESVAAARALATARGAASAAETALPETYAPPEVTAKDPVGRRGDPLKSVPRPNQPGLIGDHAVSGHAFDQIQTRGGTPTVVQHVIRYGRVLPGNTPDTTEFVDDENGVSIVVNHETGRIVTYKTIGRKGTEKMDEPISQKDREHCRRIDNLMQRYENGEMKIEDLIDGIEVYYKSLKTGGSDWRYQIERKWMGLETVFAVALDRGQSELTDEQVKMLLETIAELRELLKPALK